MQFTKITQAVFNRLDEDRERRVFKDQVASLQIGEGFTMPMADWKWKTHPRQEALNEALRHKIHLTTKVVGHDTFAVVRDR
jgi:hypothetical protein